MANEARQVDPAADDAAGLRKAAAPSQYQDKSGAKAVPLDPLVRALDHAVMRSARTGYAGSPEL
jgi:hypothetical protein